MFKGWKREEIVATASALSVILAFTVHDLNAWPSFTMWQWPFTDQLSFYTFLLAAGTLLLAFATLAMARTSVKQTRLLRREFNITHRPDIRVQSVAFLHLTEAKHQDHGVGALVAYSNIGSTPAKVLMIQGHIARQRLPLQSMLLLSSSTYEVPKEKIAPGLRGGFEMRSGISVADAAVEYEGNRESIAHNSGTAVFCIGRILYVDEAGVTRETGFCRRLNAGTRRWEKVDEPEYDFPPRS